MAVAARVFGVLAKPLVMGRCLPGRSWLCPLGRCCGLEGGDGEPALTKARHIGVH